MRSEYDWVQHVAMARTAGVPEQVQSVPAWQTSDLNDPAERAALMLTDAMLIGDVTDAVHAKVAQLFQLPSGWN